MRRSRPRREAAPSTLDQVKRAHERVGMWLEAADAAAVDVPGGRLVPAWILEQLHEAHGNRAQRILGALLDGEEQRQGEVGR